MFTLTPTQEAVITADKTNFLLGPAGTGKTTALRHRLAQLLHNGEPAYTILVVLAEQEHRPGYLDFLHTHHPTAYADLKITTYTHLAREMVSLFWPLVARPAGFEKPYQPPSFLSYDLAQILMWRMIAPLLTEGAFANLRLRPQQIVSQLIDTLNRAALNGLSLNEAIERQVMTSAGESPDLLRLLQEAANAARRFRDHCRKHSLLDLSLIVRTFDTQLVSHPEFYRYFSERFRHLLVDNVEEQTPAGQNFIAKVMDATQSTTIAYDAGGGYKRFLSADPSGANKFYSLSQHYFYFGESYTTTLPLIHLSNLVQNHLTVGGEKQEASEAQKAIVGVVTGRYRREMVVGLAEQLHTLIYERGVPAGQIAIIAPYLDGAIRYSLANALRAAGIPYYLLQRRSSPRDEPRIRAWLTWLALAHPDWQIAPSPFDVAEALTLSMANLDPARAQLLTDRLYQPETPALLPIRELPERFELRAGRDFVTMFEDLRQWLLANGGRLPLDLFLHRLFNDLLARPPFQPTPDKAGAAVCEWLVRTAGNLGKSARQIGLFTEAETGRAFIEGIYQGLVTADPPDLGDPPDPNGVMIATIYGYLLTGRDSHLQVWLETAATGWWDIPRQPLSNAFVLVQSWPADKLWTMEEDFRIRNQLLERIIRGLTARCNGGIILANSDLDRRGVRQEGVLWRALQTVR